MKLIIVLIAVAMVVSSTPFNTYEKDGAIEFDHEFYEDSPVGFAMKGKVDPNNEELNKIETFLRLAGEYIPILQSLAQSDNTLKFQKKWNVHFMGINVEFLYYLQLIVGWTVHPGEHKGDRFDVTYTPFAWGSTAFSSNGTAFVAQGVSEITLEFLYAYAPISLSLYDDGKVCFSSWYDVDPVHFGIRMDLELIECQDEILDSLLNGSPDLSWSCDLIDQVDFNFFEEDITPGWSGNITGTQCINF
mmetsp:Transcript_10619/g.9355  ORF Transcript_10619/g.9355 Transcript_10619/m.9355 type:complete len:246 (+) Transcript_10619:43-780(+)